MNPKKLSMLFTLVFLAAVPFFAQAGKTCPPKLASLMPKDAVNLTENGEADLPFEFRCPPPKKYPAHLKMTLKHCDEKAPEACMSQQAFLEREMIVKDKADMIKARDNVHNVAGITPVTEETIAGGTAIYFESEERCWAAGAGTVPSDLPYLPTINFKWYAHTKDSAIAITITGNMSVERAKEIVEEIEGKFRKQV